MIYMAIHTRDALLVVGRVGKVHAVFFVAVDAQGRDIIGGWPLARVVR